MLWEEISYLNTMLKINNMKDKRILYLTSAILAIFAYIEYSNFKKNYN